MSCGTKVAEDRVRESPLNVVTVAETISSSCEFSRRYQGDPCSGNDCCIVNSPSFPGTDEAYPDIQNGNSPWLIAYDSVLVGHLAVHHDMYVMHT